MSLFRRDVVSCFLAMIVITIHGAFKGVSSCLFGYELENTSAPVEPKQETVRYYLNGMWASIDACRRGELELSGMGKVIFDHDQSAIRYDCTQTSEWGDRSHVVITPLSMLEYIPGRSGINLYPPGKKPASQISAPPDVRLIGLLTLPEWQFRVLRAEYAEAIEPGLSIEAESDEQLVLVLQKQISPDNDSETVADYTRRLVLDKRRSLVPIRLDLTVQCEVTKYLLRSTSETQWAQIGNALVPTHSEQSLIETIGGVVKKNDNVSIDITWNNVNGTLDSDAFEPSGLSARDGTLVTDFRMSPPLEKRLGYEKPVEVKLDSRIGAFRLYVIGVNIFLAIFAIGVLAYRKLNVRRR